LSVVPIDPSSRRPRLFEVGPIVMPRPDDPTPTPAEPVETKR
jgi:hypothetical protein